MKFDFAAKDVFDPAPEDFFFAAFGTSISECASFPVELAEVNFNLADRVRIARYPDGKRRLLILEFQAQHDETMILRVLLYWVLVALKVFKLRRKLVFPQTYVLYIGKRRLTMRDRLRWKGRLFFRTTIVDVRRVPYQNFLALEHPAQVLFAVLAGNISNPRAVYVEVVQKVKRLTESDPGALRLYLRRLLEFSRLRNMQDTMLSIIEDYEIPMTEAEIQADPLYKQGLDFGERRGREEAERREREAGRKVKRELVARLRDLGMSDDFIADAAGLSLSELRRIDGAANE